MLPTTTHDEHAEQRFIGDLKSYLRLELDPARAAMCAAVEARSNDLDAIRDTLLDIPEFQAITLLQRASQDLLWTTVGESIDRQIDTLNDLAVIDQPIGSLTLDPAFETPDYIAAHDTHLMPGGFGADGGDGDVRQGALMDRGGAVYMIGRNGRNGGLRNDGRAHSIVQHLYEFHPDLHPRAVVELGVGVGNTISAMPAYFPDATLTGCDVGASVLRYAHARSERLGVAVDYRQARAEATGLPADAFDLVYTSAVFHEVSAAAIPAIIAEALRILRPGGVLINLDVSGRYAELGTWQRISGGFDQDFNNEIGWRAAVTMDYPELLADAGFEDVRCGYQPSTARADRDQRSFRTHGYGGVGASWYMSSGRKPSPSQ